MCISERACLKCLTRNITRTICMCNSAASWRPCVWALFHVMVRAGWNGVDVNIGEMRRSVTREDLNLQSDHRLQLCYLNPPKTHSPCSPSRTHLKHTQLGTILVWLHFDLCNFSVQLTRSAKNIITNILRENTPCLVLSR